MNIQILPTTKLNLGRLFVDLDGVMADFDQAYYNHFGCWPSQHDDDTMWSNIRTHHGDTFFRELPPCPGALDAWEVLRQHDPIILTACPTQDYENIATQKHAWVRKNLSGNPLVLPVLRGINKVRFLQHEGDILIDDFEKNLLPWRYAGGVGLLHRNWAETLEDLRAIHNLKRADYADVY